jgi:hypothetical protein
VVETNRRGLIDFGKWVPYFRALWCVNRYCDLMPYDRGGPHGSMLTRPAGTRDCKWGSVRDSTIKGSDAGVNRAPALIS